MKCRMPECMCGALFNIFLDIQQEILLFPFSLMSRISYVGNKRCTYRSLKLNNTQLEEQTTIRMTQIFIIFMVPKKSTQ